MLNSLMAVFPPEVVRFVLHYPRQAEPKHLDWSVPHPKKHLNLPATDHLVELASLQMFPLWDTNLHHKIVVNFGKFLV